MIAFDRVSKTYRPLLGRRVAALESLTLAVPAGEVLGIAGPNGAGKSTLIALLLGFLHPTAGRVRVDGLPPRDYVERHGVGYLSELVHVPKTWQAREALARYAVLAGVPRHRLAASVDAAVDRLGLAEHAGKRVGALSKGTLQRLGLAQALLGDARVLVFDEPTHGLDPLWTHDFRALVRELRAADRAILVASHNLDELQRVADRVAILDRGRLRRVVDVRAAADGGAYRLVVQAGLDAALAAFPGARPTGDDELEVRTHGLPALNTGLARAIAGGAVFAAVAPAGTPLEAAFRESVAEAPAP